MANQIDLHTLFANTDSTPAQQRSVFALSNLGILESLANGSISATDAIELFFHADNCLFVHNQLRDRTANQIMSQGVQLPDLFMVLPQQDAQREFQRELTALRALCLSMLEEQPVAA